MGYGNPLFDGDEPLTTQDARQRIVSMRLTFHGWRPKFSGERAGSVDHDDEHGGGDAQGQRSQEQARPDERR